MTVDRTHTDEDCELRAWWSYDQATTPAGSHPSEDDWARLADGTLPPADREALADHIVMCPLCRDVYRAVRLVRDGAPSGAAVPAHTTTSPWTTAVARFALAATVVAAVAGGWWWQRSATPKVETAPTVASLPGAGTTPAEPASDPVVALAPRAWAVVPEAPAIVLPAALLLPARGANANDFGAAFGVASAAYREGRFTEAATALNDLTARFSEVPEGWFYLGASRLLSGDAAGAVEPLRRARTSTVVGPDAAWLEAVALERAGRRAEAATAIRAMCAGAEPNRSRACAVDLSGR